MFYFQFGCEIYKSKFTFHHNTHCQLNAVVLLKDLDDLVAAALIYYGGKNVLDSTPLLTRLEKDNDPRLAASSLKFPGRPAIDTLNNRVFISDINHNRIVCPSIFTALKRHHFLSLQESH